jgi:glycosyltransferase involved in cell wall biosynthesis
MIDPVRTKPRLWIVCEVYYPEKISTGYYLTSIAEGLAADFDVKVLCGQPNYAARGTVAPKHEFRNGTEIFRASSTTLDKNVIPYRVINMLTLGISMFWKALMHFRRGDKVLMVTAPPSLPYTIAPAALLWGASYVPLLHDCYPEILLVTTKATSNSFVVKLMNVFNRWLFKHAARLIVVGRDMRSLMERKTAGLDIPIDVIPNWADLETIHPTPRDENVLLKELGLADKFVLLYAGNIGHPTDIETIIEAADKLRGESRFHFVFIGSGAKRQWLEEQAAERKLENVTILDVRPREDQINFLNACDAHLVTLVKGMWGLAMPSRTYNALASGKPIIGIVDKASELELVIEEERAGWCVEPGDVNGLVEVIRRAATTDAGEMGARSYAAAKAKYSLATAIEAYRRVLGGRAEESTLAGSRQSEL